MDNPNRMANFGRWLKKHIIVVAIVIVAIILAITLVIYTNAVNNNSQPNTDSSVSEPQDNEPEPEPVVYYSSLTGQPVDDESSINAPITAVMIENSQNARPQSGLKNSGLVFEAIAEGGITRFAVLYQQEKPTLIGPVRSVRMYYLNWITPFQPSIAHVGGSPDALSEVRSGKYRDIDQFFNANSYWRANNRYAPHNVYTNFDRLDKLNSSKGYKTSNATPLERKDSEATATPTATSITVKMSSQLYNSSYVYDKETNLYKRWQAGQPHRDREQGQITPRVVVVMKVPRNAAVQKYNAIGKGSATIFQDGTVQQVTWHKASATSQLTFTDKDGDSVALARGQTWIAAIPQTGGSVTWK